ncbi:MAG: hypothetical protein P9L99_07720 [Candidatus Lernaella stagnicola]|nr:hypothetical protein [Candidatus Lernaella stagnicola]
MKVIQCHELFVKAPDTLGVGACVFARLVGLGANVLAFNGWAAKTEAQFVIVLEDELPNACRSLEEMGCTVEQRTAITVDLSNQPGSLVALLRTLADANIDVLRSYATCTTSTQTRVVLQTSDNQMARHVISTIPGRA